MKKLTSSMNKAVVDIYLNKSVDGVNKSTIKALKQRDILNTQDNLTELGRIYAISRLPLAKQCLEISVPLHGIKLQYRGRPEPAVLSHYETLGYIGVSCEGAGILISLKALMLDKLAEFNYFEDREDACTRYLEAQFTILEKSITEIISEIKIVTKSRYISNFEEIISKPFIAAEYPELSSDFAEAIFDAIDKACFIKIATKIAENPYTYRNGWPDLTLIKNNTVSFVEVKTTDKLHKSQLITIPAIKNLVPFEFSVCKVTK